MTTFTTTHAQLTDALKTVALGVSSRPGLPVVLAGVLLDTTIPGELWLSTFDHETAVVAVLAVDDCEPGRMLVGHAELTKLLGALVKGLAKRVRDTTPVTVSASDTGAEAVLRVGGHEVPLDGLPVEDFPALPAGQATAWVTVDRAEFTAAAHRVLVATSGDTTMPFLTGVLFDPHPHGLVLAATDRYRLAEETVAVHGNAWSFHDGRLIHGKTLAKILKYLGDDTVKIGIVGGFVQFACGDATVYTRPIDVNFPKYKYLLPAGPEVTVQVDRAAVLTDTERAAAVLDAKRISAPTVTITVDPIGSVAIAATLPDRQPLAPPITATVDGARSAQRYQVRPGYLLDALKSFTGTEITIHMRHRTDKPIVITDKPDGLTDPSAFRHLVMPVRQPK